MQNNVAILTGQYHAQTLRNGWYDIVISDGQNKKTERMYYDVNIDFDLEYGFVVKSIVNYVPTSEELMVMQNDRINHHLTCVKLRRKANGLKQALQFYAGYSHIHSGDYPAENREELFDDCGLAYGIEDGFNARKAIEEYGQDV